MPESRASHDPLRQAFHDAAAAGQSAAVPAPFTAISARGERRRRRRTAAAAAAACLLVSGLTASVVALLPGAGAPTAPATGTRPPGPSASPTRWPTASYTAPHGTATRGALPTRGTGRKGYTTHVVGGVQPSGGAGGASGGGLPATTDGLSTTSPP